MVDCYESFLEMAPSKWFCKMQMEEQQEFGVPQQALWEKRQIQKECYMQKCHGALVWKNQPKVNASRMNRAESIKLLFGAVETHG